MGAMNGVMGVFSPVRDVVATLTRGFIWGGVALVILEKPGGGAPPEFLNLGAGTLFTPWLPNALVLLVAAGGVLRVPPRPSQLGPPFYAAGGDRLPAVRHGVKTRPQHL